MSILSDVAGLANPYGVASKGEWNLTRGVFTNAAGNALVFFYEQPTKDEGKGRLTAVDTISDSGGRRLAVYEYPYVDGQLVDDLGRKGETFTFNIKFHGVNYQENFNQFIYHVVNSRGAGTLSHPVRGAITCRFKEYEFNHKHDEWSAVSIKATFIEDNTGAIELQLAGDATPDSAIRSALQTLVDTQAAVSARISQVTALLLLPGAIKASLQARLDSIRGQISGLIGQLAATFATSSTTATLAAQAVANSTDIISLTDGTITKTTGGTTSSSQLPPVFQVGFDPSTQAAIQSQQASFVSANTITTQQAVTAANKARANISAAISEINLNFGNQGFDIVLQYRGMAVAIQQAVETCISTSLKKVKVYTVPSPMSLRAIAFKNGLSPNRQNDIEALNPYLGSVNWVPAGSQIIVPAS